MSFQSTMMKTVAAAAALTMLPTFAIAQSTLNSTIDAQVQSTLTLTEVQPLSFGTLAYVTGVATGAVATMAIAADGTVTVTNGGAANDNAYVALGGQQNGEFSIDVGTAGFFNISVTFPATATLTNPSAPGGNGVFAISAIAGGAPSLGSGTGGACTAGCTYTTDGTGVLTFPVEGTLSNAAAEDTFVDGAYTANLAMSAAFQ